MRHTLLFSFFLLTQSLFGQLNLELLSNFEYPGTTLAGCWHYRAVDGTPYALVGTNKGLSIVDLTNPRDPVEVQHVAGQTNNWREVKTYQDYAYVVTEANNSGVQIVDLRGLPDTAIVKEWFGNIPDSIEIVRAHAVAVDETMGFLYLFGGDTGTNGATICDISNPWNPQIVGRYTEQYIHDGYLRNDTLWASEIYEGQFSVIDVSDKENPKILAIQPTPGAFNHNSWLSDDSRYCFTADETPNTPLGSFDVSDLDNITLLDRYYPSQRPEKEVHNVRVNGRYLVNACYGGQLTIVDAERPDNLVETAWAIMGQALAWDADPYLSDSIIIATEKITGLHIFRPSYTPAAWLEGNVTDAVTGFPLNDVQIQLLYTNIQDSTNTDGDFKTGTGEAGTYALRLEKPGYTTDTLENIILTSDQLTLIQTSLYPESTSNFDVKGETFAVNVWPTVFSEKIHIAQQHTARPSKIQISLFNEAGQVLFQQERTDAQTTIGALSTLSAGFYFLKIEQAHGVVTTKRLVKK